MITNSLMYITVHTPNQLQALALQLCILGVITALIFLLIAVFKSNRIKFEGGANPKDPRKRRLWFWIIFVSDFSMFFLVNFFYISLRISDNLQQMFMIDNLIGTLISAGTYVFGGFILSKVFSAKKIGHWFSSQLK